MLPVCRFTALNFIRLPRWYFRASFGDTVCCDTIVSESKKLMFNVSAETLDPNGYIRLCNESKKFDICYPISLTNPGKYIIPGPRKTLVFDCEYQHQHYVIGNFCFY